MNYLLVLLGYLIGAIPTGLIVGKCFEIDVRQDGSGNIGATNVNRLLGKKLGLLTLALDMIKGIIPMLLTAYLLKVQFDKELWVILSGGAAFLGHIFPVYLGFKGGKGVATALGIFVYLAPVAVLIDLLIFVIVVRVWGFVSLGSLTASAAMPALIWLLKGSENIFLLALIVGVLTWIKHYENIKRLIRQEEKSWRKTVQENSDTEIHPK